MKTIQHRDKGNGEVYGPDVYERPLDRAFQMFALYELGFGGQVTDLTETSITTVSWAMNCKDTTLFEGTAEELKPFLQLAVVHCGLMANDETRNALSGAAFQTLERIFSSPGGGVSPLLLKLGGDQIMGEMSLKVSLIAAFDLGQLKYLPVQKLVEVMMFILGGDNREEVIAAYEIPVDAGPDGELGVLAA
jgi:hypothetical protein